jgi:hypothetical protein
MGVSDNMSDKNSRPERQNGKDVAKAKNDLLATDEIKLDVGKLDQLASSDLPDLSPRPKPRKKTPGPKKNEAEGEKSQVSPEQDFDAHVDRCLSMILHHDEVRQMAEIIKRLYRQQKKTDLESG